MKKTTIITLCALALSTAALAQAPLKPENWQKLASENQQTPEGQLSKPKAYIVSNAHFDTQWNWDIQTSIRDYVSKTLDRNLLLLERYPDYIFNFEGGVKYAFMKEYYPAQYELIKKYIEEGRWHISGATWDATDPNIPSPESFTRNILYGQQFYKQEFGVESTDIFLPDCFGFGWTLPTIAAHSGLIGFSTQKLQWRNNPFYGDKKVPFDIGFWQGIDGQRIMVAINALKYTTKWYDKDLSYNKELQAGVEANPLGLTLHYYGTGDTGGAANLQSVIAVQNGVHGDGPVQIISAESDRLFRDYLPYENHPELPVWNDELLMDVHGTGCYTSQAAMKKFNRLNEQLADAAERSAVIAEVLGLQAYPSETLSEAWKRFIWHQFHDDLTGTSIPRAYEFSWNDELLSLKDFESVLESSVAAIASKMNTKVAGTPVVVYNPLANAVSTTVQITMPKLGTFKVYDARGRQVRCQEVSNDGENTTLIFEANVPGVSFNVFDVRYSKGRGGASYANGEAKSFENAIYRITFDASGDITSIVDKRYGRELVEKGGALGLRIFEGNLSEQWPAWEILKETVDKEPVKLEGSARLVENGPLRKTVLVTKKHGESVLKQYISLTNGPLADRIDFRCEIDWASKDALLKASFPLSVSAPKARYDLGIGSVLRGTNTTTAYEVIGQKWADLTAEDGSYGVSILNDSKYGWDFPRENELRLTLLHTPGVGPNRYVYQDVQDFGHHSFTYSIVGHKGDYNEGETVAKAEVLNQPLKAYAVASKHAGALGREFSAGSLDNQAVVMKALKKAEDGSGYVVRFYETSGSPVKTSVALPASIVEAAELNGNEARIGDATFAGKNLDICLPAFGIKTYFVRFAEAEKKPAVVSQPLKLKYNAVVATFDAYRADAAFDMKGLSYAAELLPEKLVYGGVEFTLADPALKHAVRCKGQKIDVPAGAKKVYLLAASRHNDVFASFKVGSSEQVALVPSFTGFIGQWGHTGHTEGYLKAPQPAFVGTHAHSFAKNENVPYQFTYMFKIGLDVPAGATSIELPACEDITVFAATAVLSEETVCPVSDILGVGLPEPVYNAENKARTPLLSPENLVESTGAANKKETADKAVDGDISTKWCDTSSAYPKYISFDLGEVKPVSSWYVLHAGLENVEYITREFRLEGRCSETEDWKVISEVKDNFDLETDITLDQPVEARYLRLVVISSGRYQGTTPRIYEFQVY